jgi:hypothetical protein
MEFLLRAKIMSMALDLASAVTTRLSAGGPAPLTFDVLHEYASDPPDSAHWSRDAAQRFRNELS